MFTIKSFKFRAICLQLVAIFISVLLLADLVKVKSVCAADFGVSSFGVGLSESYSLASIRGIKFDQSNPFELDFILSKGDTKEISIEEKSKLIRLFLAALTIPEDKLWVNLSPYEENRIIDDSVVKTEIGETLLAQDYFLKQLSSTLTNPNTELGQAYWNKMNKFNSENAHADAMSKIWISPKEISIYSDENTIFLSRVQLDVKAESDLVNELISPVICDDVNSGKNFALLRQMINSIVLAQYFKRKFAKSLYSFYFDAEKLKGVDTADPFMKERVFEYYVKAFETGSYNITKKEKDETGRLVKRAYFSGGISSSIKKTYLKYCDLEQLKKELQEEEFEKEKVRLLTEHILSKDETDAIKNKAIDASMRVKYEDYRDAFFELNNAIESRENILGLKESPEHHALRKYTLDALMSLQEVNENYFAYATKDRANLSSSITRSFLALLSVMVMLNCVDKTPSKDDIMLDTLVVQKKLTRDEINQAYYGLLPRFVKNQSFESLAQAAIFAQPKDNASSMTKLKRTREQLEQIKKYLEYDGKDGLEAARIAELQNIIKVLDVYINAERRFTGLRGKEDSFIDICNELIESANVREEIRYDLIWPAMLASDSKESYSQQAGVSELLLGLKRIEHQLQAVRTREFTARQSSFEDLNVHTNADRAFYVISDVIKFLEQLKKIQSSSLSKKIDAYFSAMFVKYNGSRRQPMYNGVAEFVEPGRRINTFKVKEKLRYGIQKDVDLYCAREIDNSSDLSAVTIFLSQFGLFDHARSIASQIDHSDFEMMQLAKRVAVASEKELLDLSFYGGEITFTLVQMLNTIARSLHDRTTPVIVASSTIKAVVDGGVDLRNMLYGVEINESSSVITVKPQQAEKILGLSFVFVGEPKSVSIDQFLVPNISN